MLSNDRSRIKGWGALEWPDLKEIPKLQANARPYEGVRFPRNGEPIEITSEGQVTKVVKGHMYLVHTKDPDSDPGLLPELLDARQPWLVVLCCLFQKPVF